MAGWLRRMLQHFPPRLLVPAPSGQVRSDQPRPALPLTRVELERTRPAHRRRLEHADRVLRSYEEADGALRLYLRRP